MGYVENILGDNERLIYQTHQHAVVLLQHIAGALFTFLVFLGLAIAVLAAHSDEVRFIVGLIALGSLILPLSMIVRGWNRARAEGSVLTHIWMPAVAGLFILIVALLLMFQPQLRILGVIAVLVALVPLVELVRGFLDWQSERYIITNRRVLEIKGIINKLVRDSALEKVNDVEMRQSVIGRLLNYGTVQIITGSDIGVNMFRRIANPVRFKREMLNAKEQLHGSSLTSEVPAFSGSPQPVTPTVPLGTAARGGTESISERLAELAELYQNGFITEEEYQLKRRELLDQL